MVALAITLGVASLIVASFICYLIWPDKDSSLPAWVQAIGAIVAIIAAGLGVVLQLRHTERADKQRRKQELANLLRALASEAKSYGHMLVQIQAKMDDHPALQINRQLQLTFPPIATNFYVYQACAPMLGTIHDDDLRNNIVFFYSEMTAFLSALNRNSEAAAQIPCNEAPSGDLADQLSQMGPQLEKQITSLVALSEKVNKGLAAMPAG